MNNDCIMVKCPLPDEIGVLRNRVNDLEKAVFIPVETDTEDFKQEKQELHWQQKYVELKKNFVYLKEINAEVNAELRNKEKELENYDNSSEIFYTKSSHRYLKLYQEQYKKSVELQSENARLKEERDFLNKNLKEFNVTIDELLSDSRRHYKEKLELKSEIESLNALIVKKFKEYQKETSSIRYEWQSEVQKLIESKRDLQINYNSLLSELESIKSNQLSKEEIETLKYLMKNWFNSYPHCNDLLNYNQCKNLIQKLQSMVGENK